MNGGQRSGSGAGWVAGLWLGSVVAAVLGWSSPGGWWLLLLAAPAILVFVGAARLHRPGSYWLDQPASLCRLGIVAVVAAGAAVLVFGWRLLSTAVPTTPVRSIDHLVAGAWSTVAGAGLLAAALVLTRLSRTVSPDRETAPGWRLPRLAVVTVPAGLVTVLAAGTAGALAQPYRAEEANAHAVDATTAAATAPAGTGHPPTGVAWRYQAPSGVLDVVRSTAGPIVVLASGVVALDSRHGRPRWRYLRSDSHIEATQVTPDLRTLLLWYGTRRSRPRRGNEEFLAVLDTMTGRVRSVQPLGGPDAAPSFQLPTNLHFDLPERLTDTTYANWDGGVQISVRNLADRAPLWTKTYPPDCEQQYAATHDTYLIEMECDAGRRSTVFSYAARTGALQWKRSFSNVGEGLTIRTSDDQHVVMIQGFGGAFPVELLLDPRTGGQLYTGSAGTTQWPDAQALVKGRDGNLVVYDTATRTTAAARPIGNLWRCADHVWHPSYGARTPGGMACMLGWTATATTVGIVDLPSLTVERQVTVPVAAPSGSDPGSQIVGTPGAVAVFVPGGTTVVALA